MKGLKTGYNNAKTDEERMVFVKQILAAKGKPIEGMSLVEPTANQKDVAAMVASKVFKTEAEAWKFLKGGEKNMVVPLFKALMQQQEDAIVSPENRKSPAELLQEAKSLAGGSSTIPGGGGTDKFTKGKTYQDGKGNKAKYLGDGKWENI